MKILLLFIISVFLTGSIFTSCKKDPVSPKPCDTCNLNQDSLTHVKDSLAHAFVWTEYINKMPGETSPSGAWIFGQNDIYIVANSLWHFDGTSFTIVPVYDRTFNNTPLNLADDYIFALTKTDIWITASGGEALHTTDGKYYDDYRFGGVNACWGTSSNDMFFVGNVGNIYHYDGSTFTPMTSNTTKDLRSVWGTSHNDVWATGWNSSAGTTVLLHYNGTSWAEDQFSSSGTINNYAIGTVWACDSLGHSIAVIAGTRVFHKTDNGAWRSDTSEVGNGLGGGTYIGIGAFGGTATDIMAVGGWGFVGHWNGKTWKQYPQFFDYSNNDYGAGGYSMNGNTVCIVGTKGGASWVLIGKRNQ